MAWSTSGFVKTKIANLDSFGRSTKFLSIAGIFSALETYSMKFNNFISHCLQWLMKLLNFILYVSSAEKMPAILKNLVERPKESKLAILVFTKPDVDHAIRQMWHPHERL